MFRITDVDGNLILMKDGVTPFEYSSKELARIGRGILQGALGIGLRVVEA